MAIPSILRGRLDFRRDDAAVSAIIGGLLFLTIVIIAMVNFRVAVVPMLDEQREMNHMAVVGDRFAAVKGEADRQVDGRGRSAITVAVPLKPGESSTLFTDGSLASFLSFEPLVRPLHMETNELLVQLDNGTTVFGPDETWTNITGSSTVQNVTQVAHLRVRIEDPAAEDENDEVVVTLKDANDVFAGDLRIYIDKHSSGYSVNTRVRDAQYDVLYDQGESAFNQDQPPFYWVDALADEVQFGDVIGAADPPLSLTFTKNGLEGAFTMVHYEETPIGSVLVGGAGKLYVDWNRTESGGAMRYISHNLRFIQQDLYFENGGIIIEQPVGDTFLVEPALDIQPSGNRTSIRLTVPVLEGRSEMHSGRDPVPVRVQGVSESRIVGTMPRLSFNVTTEHPAVWLNFWDSKFRGAGFDPAGGGFTLTNGTDWARFDFYGLTTDPASTEHDLAVEIHSGVVQVVMRN